MSNTPSSRRFSSFVYLNIAQFLGALNDNIFKLLLVFLLIDIQGGEKSAIILAFAGGIFVMPFLLFSQAAGILADRVSKRNVIVFAKFLEIFIMTLGIFAFALRTTFFSYTVLFLMATQSAIFGPSKYGIIPEIVTHDRIPKANGILSLFTFLAIIFGTFLASFLTDITHRNFVLSAAACSIIALLGALASMKIEKTPPSGSHKKFNPFMLYEVYKTLRRARQYNHLLTAVLGAAFFLFIGAFLQLNIIPFAIESLGLTDVQGGYLFLLIAFGIGLGSFLAGKLSGKKVELGLVPLGGIGIVLCCITLVSFPTHLTAVAISLTLLGISGGLFIVPFDAFIQVASPDEYRGQTIAAKSFLSFLGVLLASAVLYLFSKKFGMSANDGFITIGIITLIITTIIAILILDYFARFMALVFSKIFFRVQAVGATRVPSTGPVLLLCRHSSWVNAFLLMATQRRGMRFIMKCHTNRFRWLAPLYRLMKIIPVSDTSSSSATMQLLKDIQRGFQRDFSLCIYIHDTDDNKSMVAEQRPIQQIINETFCPIVPVWVEQKDSSQSLRSVLKRFFSLHGRTRAMITFGNELSRAMSFDTMYRTLFTPPSLSKEEQENISRL